MDDAAQAVNEATLTPHAAEQAAAAGGITVETLTTAIDLALRSDGHVLEGDWQRWASCRHDGPAALFAGGRSAAGKALLERCRNDCAVQAECLAAALSNGERDGIWGGTTEASRRRLRKRLREAGLLGVVGEEAYIAWRDPSADREPTPPAVRASITTPWAHQGAAVAAIVDELKGGGACQIAMATASGKTHVGMWAAQALRAHHVLLLMPSLSLVNQTAAAWADDRHWANTAQLAVCSDSGDGALHATTDSHTVAAFHKAHLRGVVLATYQSAQVLVDAGVRFDLIIADEAHHLAGNAEKAYAAVLRGEIPTAATLYMTATPRRFTRRRRGNDDMELVSMDDHGPFGRRVFDFTLSDAINAGVVADYRVIVAAVERPVFDQVAAHPQMADVDSHLLAGAIAVVQAMGDQHLRSCVSFHTRVERARTFARLVGQVAELLPDVRPAAPGWSGYVHGGASVRIRERLLDRLADDSTWGVLANARALGEGVDLPELDAVAIVDPKNSETDVLQATGRALRLSGNKVGTVLLPVLLDDRSAGDDDMGGLDHRSLELVAGVLRALRAHDSDLGSRLDRARRAVGRRTLRQSGAPELGQQLRQRAARGLLRSRVELHLPGGALGDLAGAMALHLVRETTASWDEAYARLVEWTVEHGHSRIPQSADVKVTEGASSTLGGWVSRQRTLHNRGLLADDRVALLEALPGWMWQARDEAWWEKFEVLAAFVDRNGRYPHQMETMDGVRVGMFLWGCRAGYQEHENSWLTRFEDRCAALEALPGWTWSVRDAAWEEHFAQLEAFVASHGHAAPGHEDVVDGFLLGRWVAKERQKIHAGKRSADQARRLRALPGWVESFHDVGDQLWEDGYARMAAFIAEHDRLPAQSERLSDGYRLGSWLAKQREAHRGRRGAGGLTDDRRARLESLPGWTWDPLGDTWQRTRDALAAIAPQHLGADGKLTIPQGRVAGFDLSSWATTQRMARSRGVLAAERAASLEAVEGWCWETGRGRRPRASTRPSRPGGPHQAGAEATRRAGTTDGRSPAQLAT